MNALNLYTLTRVGEGEAFSRLARVLSGRTWHKPFSAHEAASACALAEKLASQFSETGEDWIRYFDGFFFSYTIEHISKEFDLVKLAADGDCVLNIELKSEDIGEDRIRRQLDQNRYYLSHIARTILSYTYVMEKDCLYCLNDHGYLRAADFGELAGILRRPALQKFVAEGIGRWFRAQDYLISPVADPEKLLEGRYFLTNQQAEFRRQILNLFGEAGEEAGTAGAQGPPIVSLTGSAGTGKTLLLFDLAIALSKKKKVLFLHGGPLRAGHRLLDERLHKVTVLSGTEAGAGVGTDSGAGNGIPAGTASPACFGAGDDAEVDVSRAAGGGDEPVSAGFLPDSFLRAYAYILVDEANRFSSNALRHLLERGRAWGLPCVFSYDPHSILGRIPAMEEAEAAIAAQETLRLELSGNIRINRPIFSFLRALFHQKDRSGHVDYSCIDVLYARDRQEERLFTAHYLSQGYVLLRASEGAGAFFADDLISREYDRVLMVLDRRFYYDDSLHLCADGEKGAALAPLYEGLSRVRDRLCLLVVDNPDLFGQVLAIRDT